TDITNEQYLSKHSPKRNCNFQTSHFEDTTDNQLLPSPLLLQKKYILEKSAPNSKPSTTIPEFATQPIVPTL
ncbi:3805_t:CDS:2, partial [Gigaspora margarita]